MEERQAKVSQGQAELFYAIQADRVSPEGPYCVQDNMASAIFKHLTLAEGSKVLDLGCGTGNITFMLAEMVGSKGQVVGVDPDKERIKVARENNAYDNVTFFEADSETFPEDQYDLIYCQYVTDLVRNKESMYKRVYENLKPGGKFASIISLQHSQFTLELIDLMGTKEREKLNNMFFFYPIEKYDNLASVNGFTVNFREEGIDIFPTNCERVIQSWIAVSHGVFDPEKADQEGLEKFRQKYSGQQLEKRLPVARYILTK